MIATRGPVDDPDWGKLVNELDSIEFATEQERNVSRLGLELLRHSLGEEFLHGIWTGPHPIVHTVINRVPWTRLWLAWLASAVELLSESPGASNLSARLRNWHTYSETVTVIEAAWRLARAGFAVHFEPTVEVSTGTKKPDLLVTDPQSDERVYVELSRVKASSGASKAWSTSQRVWFAVISRPVHTVFAGRILKSLSDRHCSVVVEQVKAFMAGFSPTTGFATLEIPGTLVLGLSTVEKEPELHEWAAQWGGEPGQFSGPPDDTNEIHRLMVKIWDKKRQLPLEHPGVIILLTGMLPREPEHIAGLANVLEEAVSAHPQLAAAILQGSYMGSFRPMELGFEPHYFLQHEDVPPLVSQHLCITNRFPDHNVSPTLKARLRAAFAVRCVPDLNILTS